MDKTFRGVGNFPRASHLLVIPPALRLGFDLSQPFSHSTFAVWKHPRQTLFPSCPSAVSQEGCFSSRPSRRVICCDGVVVFWTKVASYPVRRNEGCFTGCVRMPRVETSGVGCEARWGWLALSGVLTARVPDECMRVETCSSIAPVDWVSSFLKDGSVYSMLTKP